MDQQLTPSERMDQLIRNHGRPNERALSGEGEQEQEQEEQRTDFDGGARSTSPSKPSMSTIIRRAAGVLPPAA